ncbi:MAG: ribonuclease H-like domain-containing protein [Actinomycetales bacterium]|nr:ribonuclease H-like domain-containing protein [Actinomycetales bacterium]
MSGLLGRLATLQNDRGQGPSPLEQSFATTLRTCGLRHPTPPSDTVLAQLCGGEVVAPGVIRVASHHRLGTPRGRSRLEPPRFSALIRPERAGGGAGDSGEARGGGAGDPGGAGGGDAGHPGGAGGGNPGAPARPEPAQVALLDTETTGLAGGTGTVAFLIGVGRYHPEGLTVTQWLLTGFHAEAALLAEVTAALAGATHLATFNGRTFDAPLLRTRHRLTRVPSVLDTLTHLDLLHPTRRLFRTRWPDCRLQTVERTLLGFTREDDLPGHLAPVVWSDLLRRGDGRRIPRVLAHNRDDIVTLAVALPLVDRLLAGEEHRPDADARAVARHLASRDPAAARAYLERHLRYLDNPALQDLARHYRRSGHWEQAAAIWHELAQDDDPHSLAALSRYHEHRLRDPVAALHYAERLGAHTRVDPHHDQRLRRLRRAIGAAG